ncbi:hypothetical protein EW146_g6936 [Bondarzewia mesenterica]|uniref:P-loop containing nucleoside triphosphate hydrolase protein n=1 Tax=Bondarzewia mesenterica TaxID=1095465 RepID=A0A4S4LP09_9AGAM|nr:hypothetical protein EW146_g6936 [Bondarzewia mesenterica]
MLDYVNARQYLRKLAGRYGRSESQLVTVLNDGEYPTSRLYPTSALIMAMSSTTSTKPDSLRPILAHIRAHLSSPPPSHTPGSPPLFVALQGPQGSGKTFLARHIAAALSEESLHVATLSIDDLYLPHVDLAVLADTHPSNPLLRGRGQPGTHDIPLGLSILHALKGINNTSGSEVVKIPFFDKSLFNGEGDRVPESEWTSVEGPLDVVIFEGWCVGFCPKTREEIERRMDQPLKGLEGTFDLSQYSLSSVLEVNERLGGYVKWWEMFDVFVQIAPLESHPYVHIYKWRLQQEHAMKAKNGGHGMSDEQVKAFVDRYIPGYHFFGDGIASGGTDPHSGVRIQLPWLGTQGSQERTDGRDGGRLLRVTIGEGREVVQLTTI